jgi:hypothetical protein
MSDRNERAGQQGIQIIARAGAVLTALEHAGDGLTLSELALATGMTGVIPIDRRPSTAARTRSS